MTNQKTTDLVIMAMFLTIIIILTLTPLGYPPFPLPIGPTIIHIPVLVACFYFGLKKGSLAGLFFGLSSWYVAMTRGATPIDAVFRNPLVSVLPRVLFAVSAVYIFRLISSRTNKKVAMVASAALSTFLHTLFVLALLALFGRNNIIDFLNLSDESSLRILMMLINANILTNTIPEIILSVLVVPPIVLALKSIKIDDDQGNYLNLEE